MRYSILDLGIMCSDACSLGSHPTGLIMSQPIRRACNSQNQFAINNNQSVDSDDLHRQRDHLRGPIPDELTNRANPSVSETKSEGPSFTPPELSSDSEEVEFDSNAQEFPLNNNSPRAETCDTFNRQLCGEITFRGQWTVDDIVTFVKHSKKFWLPNHVRLNTLPARVKALLANMHVILSHGMPAEAYEKVIRQRLEDHFNGTNPYDFEVPAEGFDRFEQKMPEQHLRGVIAPIFVEGDSEISKLFSKYETHIDFVKQSLLAIYQLLRTRNAMDVYSVVYQFLSIHSSSMVDKITASSISAALSLCLRKKQRIESESFSENVFSLAELLRQVVDAPIVEALRNLLLTAASLKWFEKDVAFKIFDFLKKPKECSILDLIELSIQSIGKLLSMGEALMAGIPPHRVFFEPDPVKEAIKQAKVLVNASPFVYTGMPVEGKVDITDYVHESLTVLRILDAAAKKRYKFSSQFAEIDKVRTALRMEIEKKRMRLKGESRPTPVAVVIVAPPGVGKSGLIHFISHIYSQIKGREFKPCHIYDRVLSSQFWTGYDPLSHPIVHYSEVGSCSEALAKAGFEISIPELTSVIDSQPFPCDMAHLEDKGNVYFAAELVIIDTNVKHMNLKVLKRNPSAYERRFIYVEPSVIPEFRISGTKQLDPKAGQDRRVFDKWTFRVTTYGAASNDLSVEKEHLVGGDIDDMYDIMYQLMSEKIRTENDVIANRLAFAKTEVYGKQRVQKAREATGIYSQFDVDGLFCGAEILKKNKAVLDIENHSYLNVVSESDQKEACYWQQSGPEFQKQKQEHKSRMEKVSDFIRGLKRGIPKYADFIDAGKGKRPAIISSDMYEYLHFHFNGTLNSLAEGIGYFAKSWMYAWSNVAWTLLNWWSPKSGIFQYSVFDFDLFWSVKFLAMYVVLAWWGFHLPTFSMFFPLINWDAVLQRLFGIFSWTKAVNHGKLAEENWRKFKVYFGWGQVDFALPGHYRIALACFSFLGVMSFLLPKILRLVLPRTWTIAHEKEKMKEHDIETIREALHRFDEEKIAELRAFVAENTVEPEVETEFFSPSLSNEVLNSIEKSHQTCNSYKRISNKLISNPAWTARILKDPPVYTDSDPGNLIGGCGRNIYECMVWAGTKRNHTYAFGLVGNFAVINKHSFGGLKEVVIQVCTKPGMLNVEDTFHESTLKSSDYVDLGNDLLLVMLSSINVGDKLKHVLDGDQIVDGAKAYISKYPIRVSNVSVVPINDKLVGTYYLTNALTYDWPEHKKGFCGLPVIVERGNGWTISAIHSAGDTENHNSFASVLNKTKIESAIIELKQRGLMTINSESDLFQDIKFEDPLPKSPFRYLDCTLKYFGKDASIKVKANLKSGVSETIFTREGFVQDLFYRHFDGYIPRTTYAPPVMVPFTRRSTGEYISPYNIGLKKIMSQKKSCDRDLIVACEVEFRAFILQGLKERGVVELKPWTLGTAVNGVEYDAYARRIDASKSAGYGWIGSKNSHIPKVKEEDNRVVREPTDELKRRLVKIHEMYAREQNVGSVYSTQLKAEPRPVEKVQQGKTRLFFMSPLDNLTISRQYLGPLFTLMVEHSSVFCAAIGTNMHMEADVLYSRLTAFSDEFMEGDYGNYDQRMPFDIGWGVSTLVYNLVRDLGYNSGALKVVQGVLSDSLFPKVELLGDIFEAPGLQTSGKYATAEENSLRGVFLLMYAWKKLQQIGKIPQSWKFFDYVLPLVYGDDVLAAVKPEAKKLFNNVIYAECVDKMFGMEYTSAAKDGTLKPFVTAKEMSFLKRTFVYNSVLGRITAPLNLDSILKTLMWTIPSKFETREQQMRSTLVSVMYELFFHTSEKTFCDIRRELIAHFCQVFDCSLSVEHDKIPSWSSLLSSLSKTVESESETHLNILDAIISAQNDMEIELKEALSVLDRFTNPYEHLHPHEVRRSAKYASAPGFQEYYDQYVSARSRVQDLENSIAALKKGRAQHSLRSSTIQSESEMTDIVPDVSRDFTFSLEVSDMEFYCHIKTTVLHSIMWLNMISVNMGYLKLQMGKKSAIQEEIMKISRLKADLAEVTVRMGFLESKEDINEFSSDFAKEMPARMTLVYEVQRYLNLLHNTPNFIADDVRFQIVSRTLAELKKMIKEFEFIEESRQILEFVHEEKTPRKRPRIESESELISESKVGPIDSSVIVEHQTLKEIAGEVESVSRQGGTRRSPNLVKTTLPIERFFERPVELTSFTIPFSTDFSYNVNPWVDFFLSPTVRAKLRNTAFITCDLEITVKISGTPYDCGYVMATYIPHADNNECCVWNTANLGTGFRSNVVKYLSGTDSPQYSFLDANEPMQMSFTFVGFQDVIRLWNTTAAVSDVTNFLDTVRLGRFYFVTMVQATNQVSTTVPPAVFMYSNLKNVVLGPATGTNITIVAESDEFETGPIEKFAMNSQGYARAFESAPYIGPYAKASAMVLGAVGKAASLLGWSTPPVVKDPIIMKMQQTENDANVIGARVVRSLTLDPKQETAVGPQFVGQETDELLISSITERMGLLDQFTWATDSVPFTLLWSCAVNPRICKPYVPVSRKYCAPSPLCFAATPFSFWRGDNVFKIVVVATKFHKGIIGIYYDPNISQYALISSSLLLNKQPQIEMDIQTTRELEFCVKWQHSRAWAQVNTDTLMIQSVGVIQNPDNHKNQANGWIGIAPVIPLQSQGGSVSVLIFHRGKNMRFNLVSNQQLPTSRIMSESETKEDQGQHGSTCIDINSPCAAEVQLSLDFFGEEPRSFRSILKRFVSEYSQAITIPANSDPGLVQVVRSWMPVLEPRFNQTGVSSVNKLSLHNYLAYAFIGFRGSWIIRVGHSMHMNPFQRLKCNTRFPSTSTTGDSISFTASLDANSHLLGTAAAPCFEGAATFRLPYYSNNKFITPGNATQFDTGDTMQSNLSIRNYEINIEVHSSNARSVYVDRCYGEDATLMGWIAPPQFSFP